MPPCSAWRTRRGAPRIGVDGSELLLLALFAILQAMHLDPGRELDYQSALGGSAREQHMSA